MRFGAVALSRDPFLKRRRNYILLPTMRATQTLRAGALKR